MLRFLKKYRELVPNATTPACRVELRDLESGVLFGKKWKWLSSMPELCFKLDIVCKGGHNHQTVEGTSAGVNRSTQSQVYPPRLVQRILHGAVAGLEVSTMVCENEINGELDEEDCRTRDAQVCVEAETMALALASGDVEGQPLLPQTSPSETPNATDPDSRYRTTSQSHESP